MSFGDYILQGTEILQIKPKAIRQTAGDHQALQFGLLFIIIAGAAAALGSWTLPGLILFPLALLAGALIHCAIVHFLATSGFGGQGSFDGLFRPVSLAYLLDWVLVVGLVINIVPLLGPATMILLWLVVTLWKLVVNTVIVETVYGLERSRAIVVVGIAVAIFVVFLALASLFSSAAIISIWLAARP
jgi:hypothetical protein